MYEIKYWVHKPILSELLGTVNTLDEAKKLVFEHAADNAISYELIKELYFIEEV